MTNSATGTPESLTDQLIGALANPATDDDYDLHGPLNALLNTVGLDESDCGGTVEFTGADPVLRGPLRIAGGTSVSLAAKAVAIAKIWRMRGGLGQDISMDLRVAPHRLCPFYDKKWELLDGYAMGDPARVTNAFDVDRFYETADGRYVHPISPYPRLRNDASALLGVPERDELVVRAISEWNSFELEDAAEKAGVIMPVVRTTEELMATEQYKSVLSSMPPVIVEKIGDSDPEPLPGGVTTPLEGVRVLGRAHIIAGAGCGRALALHGADVLNVWDPDEYELPLLYCTSNVGVRSTRLALSRQDDQETMRNLLSGADIFYANRRPGYLARHGLDADAAAGIRPGIIHGSVTLNGSTGPWAERVGFDQTAGCLAGAMLLEGDNGVPALPAVPVVNDYITAWFLALGALHALILRAEYGGSYRVEVSLTRTALWLISLGIIDKRYAAEVAGTAPGHEYLDPEVFTADTALGRYRGVTEQIRMSQTPGYYTNPLIPRGSHRPEWR